MVSSENGELWTMRLYAGDSSVRLIRASTDFYHWHVELMPKLTRAAGFEWGTGFHINPTSPEEAAQVLRAAKP